MPSVRECCRVRGTPNLLQSFLLMFICSISEGVLLLGGQHTLSRGPSLPKYKKSADCVQLNFHTHTEAMCVPKRVTDLAHIKSPTFSRCTFGLYP
eukprot:SAG31_NODE_576_length_13956_cov_10.311828_10_plen_95_part_00